MPLEIFAQLFESQGPSLLEQGILLLSRLGFFQIVIPFILIFSVVFAILEKSKILGEEKRTVNAIVSLALAFVTTGALAVTGIIERMIPLVVLAIVVLLLFLLVYGLIAGPLAGTPGVTFRVSFGIAAGIAVALIFIYSANLQTKVLTGEVIGLVLLIAVIVAIIGTIVAESKKGQG